MPEEPDPDDEAVPLDPVVDGLFAAATGAVASNDVR